ncbi:MAG: hypothetical protein HZR80_09500 [Candidatus Heimdallarchaeota archaeon]
MAKHPKYQAMDDARQKVIPIAFKEFCTDAYILNRNDPYISRNSENRPIGPRPRPTFEVINKERKMIAIFYPNGYSECFDNSFREIFDKINQRIEEAANNALRNMKI